MGNSVGHQFDFCNCKQRKRKKKLQNEQKKKKRQQGLIDQNNIKDLEFKQSGNDDKVVQYQEYIDQMLDKNNHNSKLQRHNQSFAMRFNQDQYFRGPQIQYYRQNYNVKPRRVEPKAFNWNKDRIIGSGSFGTVSLGFNRDTGQIMAVKQSLITNDQDMDKIKTLEQEVWLLSQLRNDNIVRYLGAVRTTSTLNIFLQYCSGGSISSLLRQFGKFNEKLVQKYTWDILKGLEYLHALGVIHRDIKGANVLLSKNGVCKIADFGNAKVIYKSADGSMPQTMQGTPNWMAPQVIKRGEYGRFADIWSVGCLVIQMVTAKPPWYVKNAEHNPYAVLYKIAEAKSHPPFPDEISDNLKDFLKKCLQVNPFERANVYQLLRHPFFTQRKWKSTKTRRISSKQLYGKGASTTKSRTLEKQPTFQQKPQPPPSFTSPQQLDNQDILSQLQHKIRIQNQVPDPSRNPSPLNLEYIQGSSSSSSSNHQDGYQQSYKSSDNQQQNNEQNQNPFQLQRKASTLNTDISISLQTSFQFKINSGNAKNLEEIKQNISNPNQCDSGEIITCKYNNYSRHLKKRSYKTYNQDDIIQEVPEMEQQPSYNFKINDDDNPEMQQMLQNKNIQKKRNKLTAILEEIHQDKKITLSKARALIRRSSGEFSKSFSQQNVSKNSGGGGGGESMEHSFNAQDIQEPYSSSKLEYDNNGQDFNFDRGNNLNFEKSGEDVFRVQQQENSSSE